MNESKLHKQIRRAKMWNIIIFSLLVAIVIFSLIGFGIYKYQHTFTAVKWHRVPENRTNIVADLLEKHHLIRMTKEEIVTLLGEETSDANAHTSFKISNTYYEPESTLVYYLGADYIDSEWLIISLENNIVGDYCIDVT